MAGRIRRGKDVTSKFTTGTPSWESIPPSDKPYSPLPLGKLSDMSPEAAAARIRELEDEARELLHDRWGGKFDNSVKIEFGQLHKEDRDRILTEIEQLRGMRSTRFGQGALDAGFGPRLMKSFEEAMATGDKPWGRIPIDIMDKIHAGEEITAQDLWFASVSLSHQARGLIPGSNEIPSDLYRVSGRQYSQDELEAVAGRLTEAARSGEGIVPEHYSILDIESPSLDPEEGLTQIALRRYKHGVLQGETKEFKFPNALMRTGVMGPHAQTPEEIMGVMAKNADPLYESFKSFLEELQAGDWNIAGHNVGFDYGHLITAMKTLPQYDEMRDPDFVHLVDKLEHVFRHEQGKVMDTNLLSQLMLGEKMELAPELRGRAVATPHSVENLLLQTDILERAVEDGLYTPQKLTALLKRGMHSADVDIELEQLIYHYLGNMFIGGREIGMKGAAPRLRALITSPKSRVIGPRIESGMESLVPELKSHLHELGISDAQAARLTPQQQMMLLARLQNFEGPAGEPDLPAAIGMYRNFMERIYTDQGRFRTDMGATPPSLAEFRQIQAEMTKAGVPFSKLHYIERQATALLGESVPGSLSREMGDYLGMSSFIDVAKPATSRSGAVRLPRTLLEKVFEDTPEKTRSFIASPFERPPTQEYDAVKDVGLMFNFSTGDEGAQELAKLKSFILNSENWHDWGLDAKTATEIVTNLEKRGTRGSIQVASLLGNLKDTQAQIPMASRIAEGLSSLLGFTVDDTKDQSNSLAVANLPASMRELDDAGRTTYGPAFLDQGVTPDFIDSLLADVPRQQEQRRALGAMSTKARGSIPGFGRTTENAASALADEAAKKQGGRSREVLENMAEQFYKSGKKGIGAGVVVSGLALGGYYLYKKHRANKKLDETIAEQDYEETDSNRRAIKAPDYNTASYILPANVPFTGNDSGRRDQYMQTAGVVSSAHRRRIGHTQMGGNRYDHLYGG